MSGPIYDAFIGHVRDRPGAEALWSRAEGRRLDFEELAARVDTWRRYLRRSAGPPEAPLGLALSNGSAFVELTLAAFAEGIPLVAIDAGNRFEERIDLCRDLGIGRLLHRPDPPATASGVDTAPEAEAEPWQDGVVLSRPTTTLAEGPAGTALVKLTSGSTGRPVAACFSQENLLTGIRQIATGMEIERRDRVVLAIPLSHSYGFDNGISSLAVVGTALILEPSIYPSNLLRAVAEGQGTFLPLVPPLVRGLARGEWRDSAAVRSLRRVICAGGLLPREFAAELHAASGLRVHDFYGSTETGGISFETHPEDPSAEGTVGQPLPGVEIRFDAGFDSGDEVEDDSGIDSGDEDEDEAGSGAVVVCSEANLLGHLGPPGAGRPPCTAPGPRPVVTGDLGCFTKEGRLRLVGRTSDLLNVGGRKVAVSSIEGALRELAGIDDAAVIGLPDPMRGDRPVAFLVADGWPPDLASLPARLRPREIRRVETLPHDARGKLDRKALRRLAESEAEP